MGPIEFQVRDGVAEVRLNRPQALNAIDAETDRALASAWSVVNDDATIRVAILSAEGERAFCAGADLSDPPEGSDGLSFGGGLTGIAGRLVQLRTPLVAAVQGHVLGLGFELAMCADIIVAADTAIFRLPEARGGFIDHCGVVHRAIRQLPHHVAMAMIVASEPLTAGSAVQFGLVNEVVAFSSLRTATAAWTAKLLSCSPLVSQAGKQAALAGLDGGLDQAVGRRYEAIDAYGKTFDACEAQLAWHQKRQPVWQGR